MNKSVTYDNAKQYAEKHNINHIERVNEYTNKLEIVFVGSAAEFFKQKKTSKFGQETNPTGFSIKTTSQTNITISIPFESEPGCVSKVTYIVN